MRVRAATLVAVAAMLLTACQGNVFDLAVGTCFDDPGGGDEVSEVPVVECDEPHDNEVYASFTLDDGDFPGDEQVAASAEEGCLGRFDEWAGIAYADSRLVASYFAPTESSWDSLDDREIICYVFDIDGDQMTGSMEDAGV